MISLSQPPSHRPECILHAFRIKMSITISKATPKQLVNRIPLLWRITSTLLLPSSVVDINWAMCHVQITCQNHRLVMLLLQLVQVLMKVFVPLVDAITQPLQSFP